MCRSVCGVLDKTEHKALIKALFSPCTPRFLWFCNRRRTLCWCFSTTSVVLPNAQATTLCIAGLAARFFLVHAQRTHPLLPLLTQFAFFVCSFQLQELRQRRRQYASSVPAKIRVRMRTCNPQLGGSRCCRRGSFPSVPTEADARLSHAQLASNIFSALKLSAAALLLTLLLSTNSHSFKSSHGYGGSDSAVYTSSRHPLSAGHCCMVCLLPI